ncbi:hypothetical protein SV7mr_08190 [Stieleria bergensis]|uniref:Uncharacterized protein n=1 Tax=Stieleria bergensis TaxID=2528025 RepID=A0A517SQE1_9BACT|nr:hypothetical protein SV7mr_08190 [Planctomycetes bacterium SV_7m_r]
MSPIQNRSVSNVWRRCEWGSTKVSYVANPPGGSLPIKASASKRYELTDFGRFAKCFRGALISRPPLL